MCTKSYLLFYTIWAITANKVPETKILNNWNLKIIQSELNADKEPTSSLYFCTETVIERNSLIGILKGIVQP